MGTGLKEDTWSLPRRAPDLPKDTGHKASVSLGEAQKHRSTELHRVWGGCVWSYPPPGGTREPVFPQGLMERSGQSGRQDRARPRFPLSGPGCSIKPYTGSRKDGYQNC